MLYGCLNCSNCSVSVVHLCMRSIVLSSLQSTRFNKTSEFLVEYDLRRTLQCLYGKVNQINPRVVCNTGDKEVQKCSCCEDYKTGMKR